MKNNEESGSANIEKRQLDLIVRLMDESGIPGYWLAELERSPLPNLTKRNDSTLRAFRTELKKLDRELTQMLNEVSKGAVSEARLNEVEAYLKEQKLRREGREESAGQKKILGYVDRLDALRKREANVAKRSARREWNENLKTWETPERFPKAEDLRQAMKEHLQKRPQLAEEGEKQRKRERKWRDSLASKPDVEWEKIKAQRFAEMQATREDPEIQKQDREQNKRNQDKRKAYDHPDNDGKRKQEKIRLASEKAHRALERRLDTGVTPKELLTEKVMTKALERAEGTLTQGGAGALKRWRRISKKLSEKQQAESAAPAALPPLPEDSQDLAPLSELQRRQVLQQREETYQRERKQSYTPENPSSLKTATELSKDERSAINEAIVTQKAVSHTPPDPEQELDLFLTPFQGQNLAPQLDMFPMPPTIASPPGQKPLLFQPFKTPHRSLSAPPQTTSLPPPPGQPPSMPLPPPPDLGSQLDMFPMPPTIAPPPGAKPLLVPSIKTPHRSLSAPPQTTSLPPPPRPISQKQGSIAPPPPSVKSKMSPTPNNQQGRSTSPKTVTSRLMPDITPILRNSEPPQPSSSPHIQLPAKSPRDGELSYSDQRELANAFQRWRSETLKLPDEQDENGLQKDIKVFLRITKEFKQRFGHGENMPPGMTYDDFVRERITVFEVERKGAEYEKMLVGDPVIVDEAIQPKPSWRDRLNQFLQSLDNAVMGSSTSQQQFDSGPPTPTEQTSPVAAKTIVASQSSQAPRVIQARLTRETLLKQKAEEFKGKQEAEIESLYSKVNDAPAGVKPPGIVVAETWKGTVYVEMPVQKQKGASEVVRVLPERRPPDVKVTPGKPAPKKFIVQNPDQRSQGRDGEKASQVVTKGRKGIS